MFKFIVLCMISFIQLGLTSTEFAKNLTVLREPEQFKELPSIANDAFSYLKQTPENKFTTRFIFVRHGESSSNVEKSIAGRTLDPGLTDKGSKQAQAIGLQILSHDIDIDAVYSSPALRAKRTAEEILRHSITSDLHLSTDERLHERWYGPYEGASEEVYAIAQKKEESEIPLLSTFAEKFAYKAHPEMEAMQEVYERASDFLKDAYQLHKGQNVLIASHAGTIKSLFMADTALRGFDLEYRRFNMENCAVVVIEISDKEAVIKATQGVTFR